MTDPVPPLVTHRGACHCGAVRFEFQAPAQVRVQRCNCSICTMTGFLHLIVPGAAFRLVSGQDRLRRYTFNTGVAQHLFCEVCGIKSFYVPRSNPDGYSVNLHCVDRSGFERIDIEAFDGQNWEQAGHTLAHLSQPPR